MKTLPAAIFIISICVSPFRAHAQESPSLNDDYETLLRKAEASGNSDLLKLLRSWTAIHLLSDTSRPMVAQFRIQVPGDIRTPIDWGTQGDQDIHPKYEAVTFGAAAILKHADLVELIKRAQALIAAGVSGGANPPSSTGAQRAPSVPSEQDASPGAPALLGSDSTARPGPAESQPVAPVVAPEQNQAPVPPPSQGSVSTAAPIPASRKAGPFVPAEKDHGSGAPGGLDSGQAKGIAAIVFFLLAVSGIAVRSFKIVSTKTFTTLFLLVLGSPLWWWCFWNAYDRIVRPLVDPMIVSTLAWCEVYAWPFALAFIAWCIISLSLHHVRLSRLYRVQELAPTRRGYGIADFGVPHCCYEETSTGFNVTFKNNNYGTAGCLVSLLAVPALGIIYFFFGGVSVGFLSILTIAVAACYFSYYRLPARIEVTNDTVAINGLRLERDHFQSFYVHEYKTHSRRRQLGYEYGFRKFWLAGDWSEVEATEIASALNAHLMVKRDSPSASSTSQQPRAHQTRPEELRNVRPSDF